MRRSDWRFRRGWHRHSTATRARSCHRRWPSNPVKTRGGRRASWLESAGTRTEACRRVPGIPPKRDRATVRADESRCREVVKVPRSPVRCRPRNIGAVGRFVGGPHRDFGGPRGCELLAGRLRKWPSFVSNRPIRGRRRAHLPPRWRRSTICPLRHAAGGGARASRWTMASYNQSSRKFVFAQRRHTRHRADHVRRRAHHMADDRTDAVLARLFRQRRLMHRAH